MRGLGQLLNGNVEVQLDTVVKPDVCFYLKERDGDILEIVLH